jgi:azurin
MRSILWNNSLKFVSIFENENSSFLKQSYDLEYKDIQSSAECNVINIRSKHIGTCSKRY